MNAASRVLVEANFFRSELKQIPFSLRLVIIKLLVVMVLLSALGLVYVKSLERQSFSELQILEQQANQLKIENNQLMLEWGTLAAPSRMQDVAQRELDMFFPQPHEVILVE